MKQLKRVLLPILILLLISASLLWSGTTGKIAGTVVDKSTGEPLAGANVVVLGTTLGAAADVNGHYTILSVPPGTYNVQISFFGFKKTVVNNVRVFIDQTARIDLALESEAIEIGEVVVTAEKVTIKPDVATSVAAVSDKEVAQLPINNVVSAVGLQAGIRGGWDGAPNNSTQPSFVSNYQRGRVSVQGGLSIRGGEGDNILFMVDGVTMRDPRNNEPTTSIALSAVKDISVERGGFNAEYGQVRSGVINVVTREGAKRGYYGSIQGRMSPAAPKYYRGNGILDVQDPNSFVLRPFFDPAVCWTGTNNGAWDEFTKNQYPTFMGWNAVSQALNSDNNPNNDLTPLGAQRVFEYETRKKQINNEPDYDIDAGFGGPVPGIGPMLGDLRFFGSYKGLREVLLFPLTRPDYQEYTWTMQLISDITPSMKFRLSTMNGKQFTIRNNWDNTGFYFYPRYPTDIANVASSINSTSDLVGLFSDYNFSLADIGNQSIAGKLTHTVSPNTYYEISVERFAKDYNTRPTALRDMTAQTEVLPGFFEDSNPFGYWPHEGQSGIIINGGQHISKARDFTKTSATTVKADISSQVDFRNLVKGGLEFVYNDLNFDYGTISSGGQATERYTTRVQMRVFPVQAAAYAQDKLEFEQFTVNLGLRLDYSNSNTSWWDVDPYYAAFFAPQSLNNLSSFTMVKSEPQWQLSPRLGIAHPISENAKLFFNYGHFRQLPQYESMFRLQRNDAHQMTSFGNPNLILAKTVSYELGFDYIIANQYLLQMAAFYNDISDQQDFTSYNGLTSGFVYTMATSNNYQDIRGFELTLRKTTGPWWSGFVNYTYQVATTGHFGSAQQYDDLTRQKQYDEATVNLYQDRPLPQPYARASLNLFTPDDFGPKFFGEHFLGGWNANVILDWQDGAWTTWNPGNLAYVAYNVKSVDFFNTNLRIDKTISVGKFRFQLFMDMNNVFNTLRLWNTGDYNYMLSLHLPKSKDYNNMVGNDKVGDYRALGVDFQPMQDGVDLTQPGRDRLIYHDNSQTSPTYDKYFEYKNGAWSQVEQTRIDKILNDKAYIDMPNASTYWFLNPRRIFFGIRLSFDFTE